MTRSAAALAAVAASATLVLMHGWAVESLHGAAPRAAHASGPRADLASGPRAELAAGPRAALASGPRSDLAAESSAMHASEPRSDLASDPRAALASDVLQIECPDNILANPGFEAGFTGRGRVAEVVANGWTAWYERFPGVDGINYVPDYAPRNRYDDGLVAVHSGVWSQEMATSGATHTAGLWQRATIPPGTQVMAAGAAYAWATNGDDPVRSDPPGTYAMALGLDPLGGGDPNAASIVWTTPVTVTDAWAPLVIDLPVHGSTVTLFTRGQPLRKLDHNVSRWDGLCLRVLGPIGEPTPTATRLPWPSRTPRPEDPTAIPSPTVTPAPGTAVALEIALKLDLLGTATADALAAPTEPRLTLPDQVATRAALDRPPGAPTPWPELEDEATIWDLGYGIVERLGLVFLALAALVAGLVFGVGRSRGARGDQCDKSQTDGE